MSSAAVYYYLARDFLVPRYDPTSVSGGLHECPECRRDQRAHALKLFSSATWGERTEVKESGPQPQFLTNACLLN